MSNSDVFSSMMKDCLAKQYGVGKSVVDNLFSSSRMEGDRVFVENTVINSHTGETFIIRGSSKKSELDAVTKALMSLYWNDKQDDIQLPEMTTPSFEKAL